MITGTVWGVALIAVGAVATIAATQVVLATLFAARLAAARDVLRARPATATLVGVLYLLLLVLAGAAGKANGLAGALAFGGAGLLGVFGLAAVAWEVGSRLPSTGAAASPWRTIVRGSIAVSLASLLPVAGWLLVFPLTVFAGFGAWSLSLFRRADDGRAAPAVPVPAETAA